MARRPSAVASSNFAAKLSATSAKVQPNMTEYMRRVRQSCEEEAKKGFNKAELFIHACLSKPEEVRAEVIKLGLQVDRVDWSYQGSSAMVVAVHWPKIVSNDSDDAPGRARPAKRRRMEDNRASSIQFAAALSATSSRARPNMSLYVRRVMTVCEEEARKGFTRADCFIHDCLAKPEQIEEELVMLGLTVDKAERPYTGSTSVLACVRWPSGAESSNSSIPEPNALHAGNMQRECAVCLSQETICRLHPCGHMIGISCAKSFMAKPCPICRQVVRFAHALFLP
eukprot:TRINITY_DN122087_c0_g1_i1.p1 TRINITY_DN122087_c0_g1~~TRINITY_DN122087_c0_g1_i1.p1  ORF type:complete len:283 (-),score=27.28 TRINITY_DN122087_c0_g1_i1:171-1019(-)